MANAVRGFGRILSTAVKNSTRKQGFRRSFSSEVENSTVNQKDAASVYKSFMEVYSGDIEAVKELSIGAAVGTGLVCVYRYLAYGWYPFKKDPWGFKDAEPIQIRVQAMNLKR